MSAYNKKFENKFEVKLPVFLTHGLAHWLTMIGFLGALGVVVVSVPRTVCANSGNSFFETIGVSIAVGTVLGASTLPFYDQPGTHSMNLAYGASVGAVVGLGAWVYGWAAGSDRYEEAVSRHPVLSREIAVATVPPAYVWTPLVSLTW